MANSAQAMFARRRKVSTLMPRSAHSAVSILRGIAPNFCTAASLVPIASSVRPTGSDSTISARASGSHACIVGGFDQLDLGGKQLGHARPQPRAIPVEVRLVVGEEIGEGGAAHSRGRRVEHDADEARERIVFDDEERGVPRWSRDPCRRGSGKGGFTPVMRLCLRIDLQRLQHPGVHVVGADQHRQFDDLAPVEVTGDFS